MREKETGAGETLERPTCDACGDQITCKPSQTSRRNCCVSIRSHPKLKKGERCNCCWHKLNRQPSTIEFLKKIEIKQLYRAARKLGIEFYLAFRLAINGMFTIKDLLKLHLSDFRIYPADRKKPCCIEIGEAVVELDCETLCAIQDWLGDRKGPLFLASYRTMQRRFREAARLGNVYDGYEFHILRHTGIMLRAQCVRNLADLEALRKAARFRRLRELRPYRTVAESKLMERVRFPK